MIFEPRDAKSGDIVRIKIGSIYHYGIFVSEEEVIQFGRPPVGEPHAKEDIVVCVTDIDEFSKGFIVEVGVLDKKEKKTAKKTKEILSFARSRIGSGGYNLVHNNCEHFVNECVFGKKISYQEFNETDFIYQQSTRHPDETSQNEISVQENSLSEDLEENKLNGSQDSICDDLESLQM